VQWCRAYLEVPTHGLSECGIKRGVEEDSVVETEGQDARHPNNSLASQSKGGGHRAQFKNDIT